MFHSSRSIISLIKKIGRHGNGSCGDMVNPVYFEAVKNRTKGCSKGYNSVSSGGFSIMGNCDGFKLAER